MLIFYMLNLLAIFRDPRKVFTQADFSKSLKDLGLTPSAVSKFPSDRNLC